MYPARQLRAPRQTGQIRTTTTTLRGHTQTQWHAETTVPATRVRVATTWARGPCGCRDARPCTAAVSCSCSCCLARKNENRARQSAVIARRRCRPAYRRHRRAPRRARVSWRDGTMARDGARWPCPRQAIRRGASLTGRSARRGLPRRDISRDQPRRLSSSSDAITAEQQLPALAAARPARASPLAAALASAQLAAQ
jgi:hypothetical protein